MSEATDVLRAIDQLLRDLSGYNRQLKAHDDLRRHCDNQRNRIVQLEGLYAEAKAENAKLRELVHGLDHCTTWANEDGKDCWSCPLWHEKDCTAEDIERELGIEV